MPDTTHPIPVPAPIPIVPPIPVGRFVWSRWRCVVHLRDCAHANRIAPRNARAADMIAACANGRPCLVCLPRAAAEYGYRRGGGR